MPVNRDMRLILYADVAPVPAVYSEKGGSPEAPRLGTTSRRTGRQSGPRGNEEYRLSICIYFFSVLNNQRTKTLPVLKYKSHLRNRLEQMKKVRRPDLSPLPPSKFDQLLSTKLLSRKDGWRIEPQISDPREQFPCERSSSHARMCGGSSMRSLTLGSNSSVDGIYDT